MTAARHTYTLDREHSTWALWRRDDGRGVITHIDRTAGQVWWPSGEKPAGRWVSPITDRGIEYVVGRVTSWRVARRWWADMLADEAEDAAAAEPESEPDDAEPGRCNE